MEMELVEPVKLLYKDEVRVVGSALGLPDEMVYRQPFPGPGLGVRCLGAITRDRLHALREADAILREEFDNCGLAKTVWQYFIAVPDMKSVGVRDDKRYEGWPAIIRAVNTTDAMTATIEDMMFFIRLQPVSPQKQKALTVSFLTLHQSPLAQLSGNNPENAGNPYYNGFFEE